MNSIKVLNDTEKLVDRCDEEFDVVVCTTDQEEVKQYDGEFMIYDSRPTKEIKGMVKQIEEDLRRNAN